MEERLQKILSQLGFCSRRKAEEYILAKRVKVNDQIISELGFKCEITDKIEVDDVLLTNKETEHHIYLALNKPDDYVSTLSDPQGRRTVKDLIPEEYGRLFPVGRLDHNSTGLLIMTDDGEFANLITHPSTAPEKEYIVKVKYPLKGDEIERLKEGLYITREGYQAREAIAKVLEEGKDYVVFSIIIHEGKKREIRMMMQTLSHPVISLKRIRIGNINLGRIPVGKYQEIPFSLIEELKGECQKRKNQSNNKE